MRLSAIRYLGMCAACVTLLWMTACSSSQSATSTAATNTDGAQATATVSLTATATASRTAVPTKAPSGPPKMAVTQQGKNATCAKPGTPVGSFPAIVVTNSSGGTLNWSFTFPAQEAAIYYTDKLAAKLNGSAIHVPTGALYLGAGQSVTVQVYQDATGVSGSARPSGLPSAAVPPPGITVWFTNNANPGYYTEVFFSCANY